MREIVKINLSEDDDVLLENYMKKNSIKTKSEACRQLIHIGQSQRMSRQQMVELSKAVDNAIKLYFIAYNRRIKLINFKSLIHIKALYGIMINTFRIIDKKRKYGVDMVDFEKNASLHAHSILKEKIK
jgi:hypothetical protein